MEELISKKNAFHFILTLGVVSLFADFTYEGAKSISGQFLETLGTRGVVVGLVAGGGELIGYTFRYVSGFIADKTGRYWLMTIVGYILNLLAPPALCLAGNWPLAATFLLLERFGKSIRTPAKDAMLSYAAKKVGTGLGFGLHEAMDQIGAVVGPLFVSLILFLREDNYREAFAFLLIPALLALTALFFARLSFPRPQEFEKEEPVEPSRGFSKKYVLFLIGASLVAAGYIDFPLMAFHYEKTKLFSPTTIPLFFALSMSAGGLSSLFFGRLFDKIRFLSLTPAVALSSLFTPCVLFGSPSLIILGLILWGIGLGAQESLFRAAVASLVPKEKRARAFGLYHLSFGLMWFLGSASIGFLFDVSLLYVLILSWGIQLASLPFLFMVHFSKE